MKPNRGEFIQRIAEQFDTGTSLQTRELISEQIYNVLFDTQLSQLTATQFWLLSVLLHSEKSEESTDVLQAISKTFPDTEEYIKNLYKHKNLLPKGGKNSSHQKELFSKSMVEIYWEKIDFILWIQKNLVDIFSIPDNYDVLQNEIWQWFATYMWQMWSDKTEYFKNNFSIISYLPSYKLLLQANSEKDFEDFESLYLLYLQRYFKKIWYKLKTLDYNVFVNNNSHTNKQQKNYTPKKINTSDVNTTISTIQERRNPNYTWDNYSGIQKEQLKHMLIAWKNVFIGGKENLGKSHLIQAVLEKLQKEWYKKTIVYTTGNRILNEIQKRAAEDRKAKYNNIKSEKMNDFLYAFYSVDVLVIDDVDVLSWTKSYTQQVINTIWIWKNTQIIMLSNLSPAQIQWHSRITLTEWWWDYIPVSLMEKISPVLLEVQPVDLSIKKEIIKSMWHKYSQPNLFITQEMVSWIFQFMAEHISPKIYQQIIESIMINIQSDNVNISQKIYEIIGNITGKTIVPEKDAIVDVIVEEFNLDDIKKYLDKSLLSWWISGNIDRQKIYNDKYVKADSIEWIVLRACIYFIKKYYPKESLDVIGAKFNRTNASNLYKEAKDWFVSEKKLEIFLDDQIKASLKKKYWLDYML